MADRIGAIAKKLMKDDPGLSQETAWARAHEQHVKEVEEGNALRAKVIDLVRRNPAMIGARTVQAQSFDVGAALESERKRLMRAGATHEEAVREAHGNVQAQLDRWRTNQRLDLAAAGLTVVPAQQPKKPNAKAPKPAAAPQREAFVPLGMNAVEAATAAASGRLPFRSEVFAAGREYQRLMRRVEELQAQGDDYTTAFVAAATEIANEKNAPPPAAAAKEGAK